MGLSARELWNKENEGKQFVVGTEDIVGILKPGVKIFHFDSSYWMNDSKTEHLSKEDISWLNAVLHLVFTHKRPDDLNVLGELRVSREKARRYAESTYDILAAIKQQNIDRFAREITNNHNMLMSMMPRREIEMDYAWGMGRKLCGAGGGGYVLVVDAAEIEGEENFLIV
jgi:galactokinase/mevalonate kinase-like predicted kinase